MFRVVRLALGERGEVLSRRPLNFVFEHRDHAMAIAREGAEGLLGDFAYDTQRKCWWGNDGRNCQYRFVIEEVPADVPA